MEGSSSPNNQVKTRKSKLNQNTSKEHIFRKRKPQKPERGDNVIYVSCRTPINALLDRCNRLISKGADVLTIFCLGAAIQRGILLALKICEQHVTFSVSTNTFTTELLDDLEPASDNADYLIQSRNNSALKIKIFHTNPIETTKK